MDWPMVLLVPLLLLACWGVMRMVTIVRVAWRTVDDAAHAVPVEHRRAPDQQHAPEEPEGEKSPDSRLPSAGS
jgi:hypothetical protein